MVKILQTRLITTAFLLLGICMFSWHAAYASVCPELVQHWSEFGPASVERNAIDNPRVVIRKYIESGDWLDFVYKPNFTPYSPESNVPNPGVPELIYDSYSVEHTAVIGDSAKVTIKFHIIAGIGGKPRKYWELNNYTRLIVFKNYVKSVEYNLVKMKDGWVIVSSPPKVLYQSYYETTRMLSQTIKAMDEIISKGRASEAQIDLKRTSRSELLEIQAIAESHSEACLVM